MKALPVKGMAHITGGGLTENVPRMLADTLQARIEVDRWPRPAIFRHLQQAGRVDERHLRRPTRGQFPQHDRRPRGRGAFHVGVTAA